jgi:outer membrane immunogenic protein
MLRRTLLASVGAIALTGSAAFAADLPSRAPPPVFLPPPPVITWTGLYIGLNAGGTWSGSNSVDTDSVPIAAFSPAINVFPQPTSIAAAAAATVTQSVNTSGFIGGGQIGYNYQFYNNLVAGIEADIQGVAGAHGSSSSFSSFDALSSVGFPGNFAQATTTVSKGLDYLGTLRGRLGWLITPTVLIYGDGGLAYGGVSSATSISGADIGFNLGLCCGNPPFSSTGNINETRVGWTAGGGVEWMFAPNWSAKVEYLYYDLGSVNYSAGFPTAIQPATMAGIPAGSIVYQLASQSSTRFNGNIVRAGINYHFNWGYPAPIVSKY